MCKINSNIQYQKYSIHIEKECNDDNYIDEIKITLSSIDNEYKGYLTLQSLWKCNEDEIIENVKKRCVKYQEGDYFQQTFECIPTRRGLGSVLHEFIIEHRDDFLIKNVYSTKQDEDDYAISDDAEAFWQKRIQKNRAIHVDVVDRHKILFNAKNKD